MYGISYLYWYLCMIISHICTGIYVWDLIFVLVFMYDILYLYKHFCAGILSMVSHICSDIYVWYIIFVLVFMYGISNLYWYLCMVSHICIGMMYGGVCFCVCCFLLFVFWWVGGGGGGESVFFLFLFCVRFLLLCFLLLLFGGRGGVRKARKASFVTQLYQQLFLCLSSLHPDPYSSTLPGLFLANLHPGFFP